MEDSILDIVARTIPTNEFIPIETLFNDDNELVCKSAPTEKDAVDTIFSPSFGDIEDDLLKRLSQQDKRIELVWVGSVERCWLQRSYKNVFISLR